MTIGLIGKKCGMTRIFTQEGASVPVTVIEVTSNRITQIKTEETDGYQAVQVTTGHRNNKHGKLKAHKINSAQKGLFAKANVDAGRGLWEFRVESEQLADIEVGQELLADTFEVGAIIDVTGKSKGKGFQGPVKRHNFSMQDATHGNSVSHRAHGSTGQNQTPGRVFKGKKMAGQMGNKRVTVQGLEIVSIDAENNIIAVKGAIPGANGGDVILRPSNKA